MLCETCRITLDRVLRELRRPDDPAQHSDQPQAYVHHHETYDALHLSAQNSCYICIRLLQWIHENHSQWVADGDPLWTPIIKAYWTCIDYQHRRVENVHFNLSGDWENRTTGNPQLGPMIEAFQLDQVHEPVQEVEMDLAPASSRRVLQLRRWLADRIGRHTRIEPKKVYRAAYTATTSSTAGAQCLSLARLWLDDCIENHPNCEQSRTSHWYPSRLLDTEKYELGSVRLVETDAEPPHGPYITLSHSWGGIQLLSLTTSNINDFKRRIAVDAMPKTFAEAIFAARSFDVRYLWIDSLCIIQDMPEDWAAESSCMDKVYRNSFCNIGASSAVNSLGGLFHERDPHMVNPFQFRCDGKRYAIFPSSIVGINPNMSHLSKRAWVVQERWLSPRMLHSSSEQITWECRAAIACETLPEFRTSEPTAVHLKRDDTDAALFHLLGVTPEGVAAGRLALTWESILSQYSGANLTYATDKLVAFSGIVKALMLREPQDQYLAGLWKQNFVLQLAWRLDPLYDLDGPIFSSSRRYADYVAPSWSWASVMGRVRTGISLYSNIQQIAVLVDQHLEFRTSDPTGQVASGWIALQGPLREMRASYAGPTRSPRLFSADGVFADAFEGRPMDKCSFHFDNGSIGEGWSEQLYCMPLFWDFWHTKDRNVSMYGLLLCRADGSSRVFNRFGLLACNDYQWTHRLAKPMPIESLSDLPFDRTTGYTIKVV